MLFLAFLCVLSPRGVSLAQAQFTFCVLCGEMFLTFVFIARYVNYYNSYFSVGFADG